MIRKIVLIILVFLFNIIFVNAINTSNILIDHYNIVIKTNKQTLSNNNIIDELDVMLETDLTYNNEDSDIIAKKINNYLKNELAGYGELISKYSIVNEVNPYLIAGMIIEDTSCDTNCSVLVKRCNNVSHDLYEKDNLNEASCFGGSYQKFNTLDESIKSFIKYVKNNFYQNELTTPGTIYKTYKKDVRWAFRVNQNIDKIKNSSIN
ncbi:MAG: hypothetical protein IJ501_00650 [Bacilli bacterium]|nr:hypothetical protein [Bacilli bacterium]